MNKFIKQAFTLIELLVVIAIIGILSGLIVVSMSGVTQKATIAKAQVFSNSLRNSLMLNLVSEWKFDGGTPNVVPVAGDILDTWATNNVVTIIGSPIIRDVDCVFGKCVEFNGIDSSLDFGNKAAFSMGTKDQTISLWVKFNNSLAPQDETLIKTGAGSGGEGYWVRRPNGTNRLNVGFNDGGGEIGAQISATGSLIANTWYNIVIVFDRDGLLQSYINGEKQLTTLDISTRATDVSNARTLTIGAYTNDRLAGKIDEVRIFNAIMPTSQIKEQYYTGLNKLLTNGGITSEEYQNRISELAIK